MEVGRWSILPDLICMEDRKSLGATSREYKKIVDKILIIALIAIFNCFSGPIEYKEHIWSRVGD